MRWVKNLSRKADPPTFERAVMTLYIYIYVQGPFRLHAFSKENAERKELRRQACKARGWHAVKKSSTSFNFSFQVQRSERDSDMGCVIQPASSSKYVFELEALVTTSSGTPRYIYIYVYIRI